MQKTWQEKLIKFRKELVSEIHHHIHSLCEKESGSGKIVYPLGVPVDNIDECYDEGFSYAVYIGTHDLVEIDEYGEPSYDVYMDDISIEKLCKICDKLMEITK